MPAIRIFIRKKKEFDGESRQLRKDLQSVLGLSVPSAEVVLVYDIFGFSRIGEEERRLFRKVLTDPVTDLYGEEDPRSEQGEGDSFLALEYLPGQFDARAEAAASCLRLLASESRNVPASFRIQTGKLMLFKNFSSENLPAVKNYCVNPVEMREKNLEILREDSVSAVRPPEVFSGFRDFSEPELKQFLKDRALSLDAENLRFIRDHFRGEGRDPNEIELKVLDAYWSDHCRHSTFLTPLESLEAEEGPYRKSLERALERYETLRKETGIRGPRTLMDLATVYMKYARRKGLLDDLEVSEENNAASLLVDVVCRLPEEKEERTEPWLFMFKNETHNHPTEIEPFGGAATCLGGAIRDPLSGRAYVYQALRLSGSADPREAFRETREGKLPQKKITVSAAEGYSAYGNQIGVATTSVDELCHEGYKAKRMEVGAVAGAVKASWVRREKPETGDLVLLVGGRTGRDGIGGASGSSKSHHTDSVRENRSEVQKGNPLPERKLQRFFRKEKVIRLIKKCNDFGAGGIAVAVGELTDGLEIDLDRIPVKYTGLSACDLALSESQERLAVVIAARDKETFLEEAARENLEAAPVARVTDTERLVMTYGGDTVLNLSRSFLDSGGVLPRRSARLRSREPGRENPRDVRKELNEKTVKEHLSSLPHCSRQGLAEMFDSTIGRGTVLMPYGGKFQKTPSEASVQLLPAPGSRTCSLIAWGFDPFLSSYSPYLGGMYALIESVAKIAAAGGDWRRIRFSFQEYFERLGDDPLRWGKPAAALLGALTVQDAWNLPVIGGKDSMSGSFEELDVPPTLISFAFVTDHVHHVLSPEFKEEGSFLYLLDAPSDEEGIPDLGALEQNFDFLLAANRAGKILSASSLKAGGLIQTLFLMSFGNGIAFEATSSKNPFDPSYGSLLLETREPLREEEAPGSLRLLGKTRPGDAARFNGVGLSLAEALQSWDEGWESVFPRETAPESLPPSAEILKTAGSAMPAAEKESAPEPQRKPPRSPRTSAPPRVFIPVFPGTNCEYESRRVFEEAGARVHTSVFRNRNEEDIESSIRDFAGELSRSQIFMIPGGFSAGDEPDGAGKFIALVLHHPLIREGLQKLLDHDGLVLGICNGFQALLKSGLLPYGEIKEPQTDDPVLSHNVLGRHISRIVSVQVHNTRSPWLHSFEEGAVHKIPISHGEGKICIGEKRARELSRRGQIATSYVPLPAGLSGTGLYESNPNGSFYGIEGLLSPDGRILGKMAHNERFHPLLYRNIPGMNEQNIFKNGVEYFR